MGRSISESDTQQTDDSTGAVDNDYDEAALSAEEQLERDHPDGTVVVAGGLALDLVTRQLLFVRREVAPDLATYYEEESFDLYNYKMHPYLPVTIMDRALECVFLSDVGLEGLHEWGEAKTYDFPEGRLVPVPIWECWEED